MTERKPKNYFDKIPTAEQVALDLQNSRKQTSHDVIFVYVDQMPEGEFEINTKHLLLLCDDFLSGKLCPTGLNTIAFALMTSDFFHWDNNTQEGERIDDVIFDWDNPEIGYDLTTNNIQYWREYLLTGINNFDTQELKKEFRNDGRNRKQ